MDPADIISAAARGLAPHMFWQLSSRFLVALIMSVAVRAVGPTHFAYSEVRLLILFEIVMIMSGGTKHLAVRAKSDDEAAAFVYLGDFGSATTGLVTGLLFWWWDKENAGPIVCTVLSAILFATAERGRTFAKRRARYKQLARARAFARIIGRSSSFLTVALLPENAVRKFAFPLTKLIHAFILNIALETAAGRDIPSMSLPKARRVLGSEEMKLTVFSVLQNANRFLFTSARKVVLDLTCVDDVKAAFELAAQTSSQLAMFFNDALGDQTYSAFGRLNGLLHQEAAHRPTTDTLTDNSNSKTNKAESCASVVTFDNSGRQPQIVSEAVKLMQMSIKASTLASILIAFLGSSLSFAYIRLLYGKTWACSTQTAEFLNIYLMYLVFRGTESITGNFVDATAMSSDMRTKSALSVLLGLAYLIATYVCGKRFSVYGIIAVGCASSLTRIVCSSVYIARFTNRQPFSMLLTGMPRFATVLILAVAGVICHRVEHITRSYFEHEKLSDMAWGITALSITVLLALTKSIAVIASMETSLRDYSKVIFEKRRSQEKLKKMR